MINLGKNSIQLNAQAANKADAIRQAGELLIRNGNMKPGYIDSMMNREKVAHTYLGNGIAIPHGLPHDRELILETGISVVQVPRGVEWNPGEVVYLVVGIAAKSDEHIEVLANLTQVLDDEAAVHRLAQTSDPLDIVETLTHQRPVDESPAEVEPDFAKAVEVTIAGKAGLHARPATTFVNIAKSFDSEIRVRYGNKTANGKSMVSLLKLGVEGGSTVRIMAQGPDEDEALRALEAAVVAGLEEEEETAPTPTLDWMPSFETEAIPGIAASPGMAIGKVHQLKRGKIVVEATAKDPAAEEMYLRQAIATAQIELEDLHNDVAARAGASKAAIFLAHQEFLNDPDLLNEAIDELKHQHSAGWAWQQAIEQRASALEQLNDPLLAGRAVDLRDVGRRVLRLLAETIEEEQSLPDYPVILLAEDLTPSDTAGLDPALTLGVCTAAGGPTSHTAIIARSLDIPAIVGAGPAILHLADETSCILDGTNGNLYPNPTEADRVTAQTALKDLQALREAERLACYQPALMTDGHRIEVVANIGAAVEAEQAVNAGAEGIGLLRTEFLFLQRSAPPSEEEQFAAYSQMTQALNGLPLILRTLDIGGDKEIPYLNLPAEENPFLGIRGIRLCLVQPDLFKTQLRAIFRAAQTGPIKIMFPMIATLEDFHTAYKLAESVRQEVGADPVEIGMMVEVPSAVVMADEFAKIVDFFSIGTNDLTQYVLAMDRGHPILAKQADGLHPAVLRMIHQTVQAAQSAGKWVGVCGGIAGDPKGAAILAGLGVTELSVSIPSVAAVKAKIRGMSFAETQGLAKRALACRTAQEVRALS
ncbi:phosphoenolpyruvate--protein phosphotransferase [Egbenema bharatensis]|uniref:phosphoenolpyruvate--protein phosphotransferase n=1 Tax=Egbenema bharatensis TaxID=3463334 RepID=UPI003A849ECA